jgi:hypothetical protein
MKVMCDAMRCEAGVSPNLISKLSKHTPWSVHLDRAIDRVGEMQGRVGWGGVPPRDIKRDQNISAFILFLVKFNRASNQQPSICILWWVQC